MAHKEGLEEALYNLRAVYMESWARLALQFTSSTAYGRWQKLVAAPGLAVAGTWRKITETAGVPQLNPPSRSDVISLATRLTHIETALDDVSAALDRLEARTAAPVPQIRAVPRPVAQP